MTTLKKEDKAPDFTGIIETGETISLSDFRGKKLALYFYPKDNTPTCTVEACNLRDNFSLLKKHGIAVVGVSPDSIQKHTNFINKFSLPFPLISDPELKIIKAYEIWGEKKFMGKIFDGLHRTTFLIDENGILEAVITKVKSKIHSEQILETLGLSEPV